MISRHWKGVTRSELADAYIDHLRKDTFPKLSKIPGFIGASILRRIVSQGVEFLVITDWESLDAIREFAGEKPEAAVVPPVVHAMMVVYDKETRHYEVVEKSNARAGG
jgi:heme-degrading monooxygenase HmoA